MTILKRIEIFGDSILKGIQINPKNMRYQVDNHIDTSTISKKHDVIINNRSQFGATITQGIASLQKHFNKGLECELLVMDFGGNDCDFNWQEIAENPEKEHLPKTPLDVFVNSYKSTIKMLKEKGIQPILTNLPPIDPQKFFDWFCKDLNKENILKWLGSISLIYRYQELYSRTVEKIAKEEGVLLVDLRRAFLKYMHLDNFLCIDGTHPNTKGQLLIASAFAEFADEHFPKKQILVPST